MSQSISWKFQLQVQGGPSLSIADSLSMEAVEKTRVTIEAGDVDKVVSLAANTALLVVSASAYKNADPTHKLSYKVNNADAAVDLKQALILVGKAAVDRFAGAALTNLSFTSTLDSDVVIEILTARDATP